MGEHPEIWSRRTFRDTSGAEQFNAGYTSEGPVVRGERGFPARIRRGGDPSIGVVVLLREHAAGATACDPKRVGANEVWSGVDDLDSCQLSFDSLDAGRLSVPEMRTERHLGCRLERDEPDSTEQDGLEGLRELGLR